MGPGFTSGPGVCLCVRGLPVAHWVRLRLLLVFFPCLAFLAAALLGLSYTLRLPTPQWDSVLPRPHRGAAVTELVCVAPKETLCPLGVSPLPLAATSLQPVPGFASSGCCIYMEPHMWSTAGLCLSAVSCHPCCSVSVLHPWLRLRSALLMEGAWLLTLQ